MRFKDLAVLNPADFSAEWKWDGIRVQLILGQGKASLFSRTGDDIAASFPDLVENAFGEGVLDGELLVGRDFEPLPFNDLQQRLNRKVATAKHLEDYPAFVRVYDLLFDGREDIRALPWTERRSHLEAWLATPSADARGSVGGAELFRLGGIGRDAPARRRRARA